jgi:hypothetical protein
MHYFSPFKLPKNRYARLLHLSGCRGNLPSVFRSYPLQPRLPGTHVPLAAILNRSFDLNGQHIHGNKTETSENNQAGEHRADGTRLRQCPVEIARRGEYQVLIGKVDFSLFDRSGGVAHVPMELAVSRIAEPTLF